MKGKDLFGEPIDGVYSEEASMLDGNHWEHDCPKCGSTRLIQTGVDRDDEEVYGWRYKCISCNSKILIVND